MSTIILGLAITKSNTVDVFQPGWVHTKKKHPGSNTLMIPLVMPKGKTLEAKRREAHKLVDECIDTFKREFPNK